jgi:hypothetical protein
MAGIGEIYVGVWDEKNERELWRATNQPVHADFLVVLDMTTGGVDTEIAERYKAALLGLTKHAIARQDLSQYTWLFSTTLSLKQVFNLLLTEIGVEHHDYSVIELATGKGFAYQARRRAVYEISSRPNNDGA